MLQHAQSTLNRNRKLDTGLNDGNISSKPSFLRSGVTNANLYSSGKYPLERDLLAISVIIGKSKSKHFRNKSVGIGSRLHDLQGDLIMNF